MQTLAPTEQLAYSFNQAAQLLAVCARTLRNMSIRGEIETIRIGRRRLIPRAEILRLANVENHEADAS